MHRVVGPLTAAFVVGAAWLVGVNPPQPDDVGHLPRQRLVTESEFCAGFAQLVEAQRTHLRGASTRTAQRLKAAARHTGDLLAGTAMPGPPRAGLVDVLTAYLSLPDDASAQDLVEVDDTATEREVRHASALDAWLAATCGDIGLSEAR